MEKIAVLMGGISSEREVSLKSGRNVARALASLGKYEVVEVDLTEESLAALPAGVSRVYIALHGGWGENGGVQSALDRLHIPYTGPGALASAIAMDKVKTKLVLEMKGVPTAKWQLASRDTPAAPLPLPVVVKPPADGSSVGIAKVTRAEDWPAARDGAFAAMAAGSEILVEEYVPGREFTVGVIAGKPLPVIEIVAPGGWYGYDEKYRSDATRYPFLEDAALASRLQELALKAYEAVGCRGVTRIDFRVSPLGHAYVLELNTSPGFTAHSLVPKAGVKAGMSIAETCEKILSESRYD